jgi:hypothetical protein
VSGQAKHATSEREFMKNMAIEAGRWLRTNWPALLTLGWIMTKTVLIMAVTVTVSSLIYQIWVVGNGAPVIEAACIGFAAFVFGTFWMFRSATRSIKRAESRFTCLGCSTIQKQDDDGETQDV